MKYILITAFILIFAQNVSADELVGESPELVEDMEASDTEPVIVSRLEENSGQEITTEESDNVSKIVLSDIDYYELAQRPNYKPRNRILLGGIVPFIPIRSTISASDEDPGFLQKSVSVLVYFKQNF